MNDSLLFNIECFSGQQIADNIQQEYLTRPADGLYAEIREHSDSRSLYFNEKLLSKHMIALGAIGSGKTNFLYYVFQSLLQRLQDGGQGHSQDRVICFDPKGDYCEKFFSRNSVCIGSDVANITDSWNLFAEVMDTPTSPIDCELLRQIATTLFKKQIDSSNNPVFPSGARDLFVGLFRYFVQERVAGGDASFATMNNATLKRFFETHVTDAEEIKRMVLSVPGCEWLSTYLMAPQSATTQSYLAPLQAVVNEIFVGCFAKPGTFSVRQFMRGSNDRRVLFLEYDPEKGCIIDAVYTAILDLAMKEAIGRNRVQRRNVIFVLDEFPMLPALSYVDQILQFGRSIGVKVVAAIQSTAQLTQKYGDSGATNIISGFSTMVAFRLFDSMSRDAVIQRHGKNLSCVTYLSRNRDESNKEQLLELNAVTDWDITQLKIGECIVSPPNGVPFRFYPKVFNQVPVRGQTRHAMRIINTEN